jgi:uncharacterized glyoxalase superfamily protein PhnB
VRSTKETGKLKARQVADEIAQELKAPHRAAPPEFSFKTYAGKTIARGRQLAESGERNKNYIRTTQLFLDNDSKMRASLVIGFMGSHSHIMLSDESPDMGAPGPKRLGGSPVMLYLYVKGVDAVVAQAVAAGARLVHPVKDQFYGDRSGGLEDPFGHIWHVATHKEDVPPKELRKRADASALDQTRPKTRRPR